MTFTYAPELWDGVTRPTPVERIRFLIGDTNPRTPDLQDEAITVALASAGSELAAAVQCCENIRAVYSRETDSNGVGISTSRSQRFTQLGDIIDRLELQMARSAQPQFIGREQALLDGLQTEPGYLGPELRVGLGRRPAGSRGGFDDEV